MEELEEKKIKCLVWDLDHTLWNGTLLEDGHVQLMDGVVQVLEELDSRGILLSIASRNDYDMAMQQLEQFGLASYFLYPQITWGAKSNAIASISKSLNISLDTIALIDDQAVERSEVTHVHPMVRTYDALNYKHILDLPAFQPRFITSDAKMRRQMYQHDMVRKQAEEDFSGSSEAFLKTLHMKLKISKVKAGDLERVEELTLRTNQLNSTGITYDFDMLSGLISDPNHVFLIAELEDKFGSYGKIGLVLAEKREESLHIKLLLMSCRVMTRGIGSALLIYLIGLAQNYGKQLTADFIDTGRNRVMYITYKLMGFYEVEEHEDGSVTLSYQGGPKAYPDYLDVTVDEI